MYALSVIVLIVTIQDGVVMWYEALALVLTYLVYIAGNAYISAGLSLA